MVDLWPSDIVEDRFRCPVAVLREQATLLGEKTRDEVQARVKVIETGDNTFAYAFSIVAPALPGYEYVLLHIAHGLAFYPVDVFVAEEVLETVKPALEGDPRWPLFEDLGYIHAFTEEAYVEILRMVLGAYTTRQVVTALLSQVEEGSEMDVPY